MRKIEQQMIEAIRTGSNWKSANTEVRQLRCPVTNAEEACVFLHGHHIATAFPRSWALDQKAYPNKDTFRAWPTATTRSRLRALGIDASIKNFQACIDGKAL